MARRPNYGFEKRQKELEKQKKKDEKAEKRRLRQEEEGTGPDENGIDWGAAEELGVARELPPEGEDGETRG